MSSFTIQKGGKKNAKLYPLLMMHENQKTGTLQAMVMAVSPEKKERTIKGDWCDPTKDPPTVMSIFSLGHKDRK